MDPTGQAGLARDLEVCQHERIRGCPVATGITVQTSERFEAAHPVPAEIVIAQAEAALREHEIRWVKVGALFSVEQVDAVAALVQRRELRMVLDPVLGSTSGAEFLNEPGIARLMQLGKLAFLVTPNQNEAERLGALGAKYVLLKNGGDASERLLGRGIDHQFPVQKIEGTFRGTGCRLATRITAHLARGMDIVQAVRVAHGALQREIRHDAAEQALEGARLHAFVELEEWLPRILAELNHEHIPEVGMNVAYAIPGATDPRRDVVGLAGRITIAGDHLDVTGRLTVGGPHHTGRLAVFLQEYDPAARIVMNHWFDERYIENAIANGLTAVGFRRDDEPADAPSTMEWGLRYAIEKNRGKVPDLVWDRGGVGKEAMIRVIARSPERLAYKLLLMHK